MGMSKNRNTGRGPQKSDLRYPQMWTLRLKQLRPCLDEQRHQFRILEHEFNLRP